MGGGRLVGVRQALGAGGAGDQRRARRQQVGDGGQRARPLGEQEGKGRFGPDEMGDAGKPGGALAVAGEIDVALHDLVGLLDPPAFALRDVGLQDAQVDAGNRRIGTAGEADGAEAEMGDEQDAGGGEGDAPGAAVARILGRPARPARRR